MLHAPIMRDRNVIGATRSIQPSISLLHLVQRDIVIMHRPSVMIHIGVAGETAVVEALKLLRASLNIPILGAPLLSNTVAGVGGHTCPDEDSLYVRAQARLGHMPPEGWESWDADAGDAEGNFQGLV